MATPGGPPESYVPGATPPPPPAPADDSVRSLLSVARSLALLFAVLAGLLFLVFLAFAVLDLVLGRGAGDIVWAVYSLASAAVNYVLWREIPRLEQLAASRQYAALREQTIIWAVLGILFFVVVGVLLLVVWMKVELQSTSTPA